MPNWRPSPAMRVGAHSGVRPIMTWCAIRNSSGFSARKNSSSSLGKIWPAQRRDCDLSTQIADACCSERDRMPPGFRDASRRKNRPQPEDCFVDFLCTVTDEELLSHQAKIQADPYFPP